MGAFTNCCCTSSLVLTMPYINALRRCNNVLTKCCLLQGNRRYVKCLYVYNKIDVCSMEEVDEIAR